MKGGTILEILIFSFSYEGVISVEIDVSNSFLHQRQCIGIMAWKTFLLLCSAVVWHSAGKFC